MIQLCSATDREAQTFSSWMFHRTLGVSSSWKSSLWTKCPISLFPGRKSDAGADGSVFVEAAETVECGQHRWLQPQELLQQIRVLRLLSASSSAVREECGHVHTFHSKCLSHKQQTKETFSWVSQEIQAALFSSWFSCQGPLGGRILTPDLHHLVMAATAKYQQAPD